MNLIPVNQPLLNGNERKYLNECLDTGWISSEGPFVKKFEALFAQKVDRKYGIAVCNGSAALEAALQVLDFERGAEIILPSFTIISCLSAIVRAGCTPVFVDSVPVTWNMDCNQIEKKITSKTKAIMVVHIYGLPTDMDHVLRLSAKYNLKIIEDAAEGHGLNYKNKPVGSFGDISTFSFYSNKHVTTGEGGMVLTNDANLAGRLYSIRNLCFQPAQRFVHEELGYNFRMTNIQAAIGVAQVEQLDNFIKKKKEMGKYYISQLENIEQIQLPQVSTDYAENIFWVFGILIKNNCPFSAKEIMSSLRELGIDTRPFFYPLHLQPALRKLNIKSDESLPVAENLAEKGFYIPSGLGLSLEQMEIVCKRVKQVFE